MVWCRMKCGTGCNVGCDLYPMSHPAESLCLPVFQASWGVTLDISYKNLLYHSANGAGHDRRPSFF